MTSRCNVNELSRTLTIQYICSTDFFFSSLFISFVTILFYVRVNARNAVLRSSDPDLDAQTAFAKKKEIWQPTSRGNIPAGGVT